MEIEIAYRKVGDLIPYARNSRTHSEEQVAQIAASIKEFGFTNPVLLDGDAGIIAGHGRILAARKLGLKEVPTIALSHLTDAQKRAYVIADNKLALNAGWDLDMLKIEIGDLHGMDFDLSLLGFSEGELADMMVEGGEGEGGTGEGAANGSLSDRFLIPPFSVLNAREGWWQDRKREWLSMGIKSELGRGENGFDAAPGGSPMVAGYSKDGKRLTGVENIGGKASNGKRKAATFGQDLMRGEHEVGKPKATAIPGGGTGKNSAYMFRTQDGYQAGDEAQATGSGTSIFDPVLAEVAYTWFCPTNGLILDPFAGGSVRGVVASKLGRQYVGHELRSEQVAANRVQGDEICADPIPVWIEGDSRKIDQTCADVDADLVFSCPPYADLEVYSDDPADLSNMPYKEFVAVYREIIAKACARLKQDRFACFVVGEVRDKKGNYIDFVGDTVQAFRDAGLSYYNEAILVTSVGSLPIRAGKQFSASRKLGKTHQNILVFVKGDGKKAAKACGEVEVMVPEETAEGDGNE
ncbi:ParB/Sulfiredoxin [uncultured Caudovirales phage]|uniref:ParB/Sulfiredoxin n=1 Tax=uncultured Caudovirales phage TaxID=2100421 RepID=A0A6J7WVT5_9CAUD|nr:ParB/Sulfiredoxin [uncultured Caudovirales phage]